LLHSNYMRCFQGTAKIATFYTSSSQYHTDLGQFLSKPLTIWQKYDEVIADKYVYFEFVTSVTVGTEERQRIFD